MSRRARRRLVGQELVVMTVNILIIAATLPQSEDSASLFLVTCPVWMDVHLNGITRH